MRWSTYLQEPYDEWEALLDKHLQRISDISLHDLADACTRNMYNWGYTPTQAADEISLDNGFIF